MSIEKYQEALTKENVFEYIKPFADEVYDTITLKDVNDQRNTPYNGDFIVHGFVHSYKVWVDGFNKLHHECI